MAGGAVRVQHELDEGLGGALEHDLGRRALVNGLAEAQELLLDLGQLNAALGAYRSATCPASASSSTCEARGRKSRQRLPRSATPLICWEGPKGVTMNGQLPMLLQAILKGVGLPYDGRISLHTFLLQSTAQAHPPRQHSVPQQLQGPAAPAVAPMELTETLRGLRRRAGTGVSGQRNEYLRALVGQFNA